MTQSAVSADLLKMLQSGWARLAAVAGSLFPSMPVALEFLLVLSALDVITGFTGAASRTEIDSAKIRRGFWRKLTLWIGCCSGYYFDRLISLGALHVLSVEIAPSVGAALTALGCLQEFTSILENLRAAGALTSGRFSWLVSRLKQLQDEPQSAPEAPVPPKLS